MRAGILILSFLPFIYYGTKDTLFHFKGRPVTRTEHLLHAGIGVVLATMFISALSANHLVMLSALVLFVVAGSLDEYVYHRGIPAEESDLHAKEHLALLVFLVMSLATDWLQRNNWSIRQVFDQIVAATGGKL
jgi:hypothetical protein